VRSTPPPRHITRTYSLYITNSHTCIRKQTMNDFHLVCCLQDNETSIVTTSTINPDETRELLIEVLGVNTLNGSQIANTTLEIESSRTITVQVVTESMGYREGYRALPTSSAGNEYFVDTFCDLGGYCQIAIATIETGITKVIFHPNFHHSRIVKNINSHNICRQSSVSKQYMYCIRTLTRNS